ncbi:class I SAM-dependent methyltransferase [Nocardia huaxiensis]|uniref:class I SAM-dependent methyltransferase n=1 Tax=Nocardia huaxiensis TaxID=2755382 RepID=UPI0023E8B501|nr:class I SAM-dependent methyltransferase [Nocardia huaxiensis]
MCRCAIHHPSAQRHTPIPSTAPPTRPQPSTGPSNGPPAPESSTWGAGTGKLTAALLALDLDVIAVEPDPAMLTELHRTLPTVRALPGSAENIPLPNDSIDAVVAGNALHWFDMATAGPEIARVLTPRGTLSGLWNVLDTRIEWVAELERISGPAVIGPRDTITTWRAATATLHLPGTASPSHFTTPEQAEFPHSQPRTAASLVATLATRAGVLVMPEPARQATLTRIHTYLSTRPETATGIFALPMQTGVLRTRLR